jgi:hypothetical protein
LTTPSGGSSTVAGVYYEVLWCLLRSLLLRFDSPISASEGTCGILILEPKDGGGDVRVISAVTEVDPLESKSTRLGKDFRELASPCGVKVPRVCWRYEAEEPLASDGASPSGSL